MQTYKNHAKYVPAFHIVGCVHAGGQKFMQTRDLFTLSRTQGRVHGDHVTTGELASQVIAHNIPHQEGRAALDRIEGRRLPRTGKQPFLERFAIAGAVKLKVRFKPVPCISGFGRQNAGIGNVGLAGVRGGQPPESCMRVSAQGRLRSHGAQRQCALLPPLSPVFQGLQPRLLNKGVGSSGQCRTFASIKQTMPPSTHQSVRIVSAGEHPIHRFRWFRSV